VQFVVGDWSSLEVLRSHRLDGRILVSDKLSPNTVAKRRQVGKLTNVAAESPIRGLQYQHGRVLDLTMDFSLETIPWVG
jgi:hypothetical protein